MVDLANHYSNGSKGKHPDKEAGGWKLKVEGPYKNIDE